MDEQGVPGTQLQVLPVQVLFGGVHFVPGPGHTLPQLSLGIAVPQVTELGAGHGLAGTQAPGGDGAAARAVPGP
jgi:hypothetical protein